MATPGKDYVIGKGRLFFDRFLVGTKTPTGEHYFGNTPELSTSQDESTLDHYDADAGLNVKDESVTTEKNNTGSFVTDNIEPGNIVLWYGGDSTSATITAATGVVETHTVPKRGVYIQLGATQALPSGARNVNNVVVKIGATTVTPANNYDVDLALGRVFIEPDAPGITDGAVLEFTFNINAGVRKVIVGKGTEIRGALRFISANPVGSQKDYFWPYVKLTANGDFSLKGDEWQQIPFSFEVLKRDANTEMVYIDDRTGSAA